MEDKLKLDEQDAVSLTACKGAEATAEDAVVDMIDRRLDRVGSVDWEERDRMEGGRGIDVEG